MITAMLFPVQFCLLLLCGVKVDPSASVSLRHPISCRPFENGNLARVTQRSSSGPVYAGDGVKTSQTSLAAQRDGHDYVFVVGLPYSGTTALHSLLSTSPEVGNLCADERTKVTCEGTWILTNEHLIPTYWPDDDKIRWKPEYPKDWNHALELYASVWNKTKHVLVDKSPPNSVKMSRIAQDLEGKKQVKFIVLTRSPCYMTSYWGRNPEAMSRANEMAHEFKKIPSPNVLHIQYEEMLRDPYGTAVKILHFLPQLKQLDPTVDGLNTAERISDVNEFMKKNVKYKGKSQSIVDYIEAGHPFNFPHVGNLSTGWSLFMQEFGY